VYRKTPSLHKKLPPREKIFPPLITAQKIEGGGAGGGGGKVVVKIRIKTEYHKMFTAFLSSSLPTFFLCATASTTEVRERQKLQRRERKREAQQTTMSLARKHHNSPNQLV
jgi:hypothetical protein